MYVVNTGKHLWQGVRLVKLIQQNNRMESPCLKKLSEVTIV